MRQKHPRLPPRGPADDELPPSWSPVLIRRIRQALGRVGDFGEISLVVVKGEIKYIQITSASGPRTAGGIAGVHGAFRCFGIHDHEVPDTPRTGTRNPCLARQPRPSGATDVSS